MSFDICILTLFLEWMNQDVLQKLALLSIGFFLKKSDEAYLIYNHVSKIGVAITYIRRGVFTLQCWFCWSRNGKRSPHAWYDVKHIVDIPEKKWTNSSSWKCNEKICRQINALQYFSDDDFTVQYFEIVIFFFLYNFHLV